MKNILVSGFLALGIIAPVLVSAQTEFDPGGSVSQCVSLRNNLRYQSRDITTGGEVSTLQDFLQAEGYLNTEPTGYFGLLTQAAAKSFQSANGITGDGYIGPLSRAKIKAASCGTDYVPPATSNSGTTNTTTTNRISTEPIRITPSSEPCANNAVYNSITGKLCREIKQVPTGCETGYNFSYTTGEPCGAVSSKTPTVWLNANDESYTTINAGDTIKMSWGVTNAVYCSFPPAWNVSTNSFSGSMYILPTESTTYSVSCYSIDPRANSVAASQTAVGKATVTIRSTNTGNNDTSSTDPYTGASYSKTSSTSISTKEKTLTYTYPYDPCGSLMDYSTAGSVFVGDGPVYSSAVNKCGTSSTPDSSSFRVYSCHNGLQNSSVVGTATFAFQCTANTSSNFPVGCTSFTGWSSITGESCERTIPTPSPTPITVNPPSVAPVVIPAPSQLSLSVSPTTINPGQTATLMWSSTGAAVCDADPRWTTYTRAIGSTNVYPSETTTYKVTCYADAARTSTPLSKSVTITVNKPTTSTTSGTTTSPAIRLSLTADGYTGSSISVPYDSQITLRWAATSEGQSLSCSDNFSNRGYGNSGSSGAIYIYHIQSASTYYVTCTGGTGNSATANLEVKIKTETTASPATLLPAGCANYDGYSTTTGERCDAALGPIY